MQIFCVLLVVMTYSLYDYFIDKGALVGIAVSVFPWFAGVNGFTAARFFTFFNGSSWIELACHASLMMPTFIGLALVVIDTCEWTETGHADTVPFREAAILVYYWLLVSVPSCVAGSYLGFSMPTIESPVRKNRLQRERDDTSDCPTCIEVPFRSMVFGFFPTLAIVL
mmetsp:Transcript_23545/g.27509  ORF Transcript_23545/g.27509 Transcript_23545/m.27509 type:complete len:168 (+) Transcript_23545:425-928(+)